MGATNILKRDQHEKQQLIVRTAPVHDFQT